MYLKKKKKKKVPQIIKDKFMYYSLQEDKSNFSYKSTTVLNLKKKQTIISGVHICKYKYFEKSIKLPFSSSSPDAPAPS